MLTSDLIIAPRSHLMHLPSLPDVATIATAWTVGNVGIFATIPDLTPIAAAVTSITLAAGGAWLFVKRQQVTAYKEAEAAKLAVMKDSEAAKLDAMKAIAAQTREDYLAMERAKIAIAIERDEKLRPLLATQMAGLKHQIDQLGDENKRITANAVSTLSEAIRPGSSDILDTGV